MKKYIACLLLLLVTTYAHAAFVIRTAPASESANAAPVNTMRPIPEKNLIVQKAKHLLFPNDRWSHHKKKNGTLIKIGFSLVIAAVVLLAIGLALAPAAAATIGFTLFVISDIVGIAGFILGIINGVNDGPHELLTRITIYVGWVFALMLLVLAVISHK